MKIKHYEIRVEIKVIKTFDITASGKGEALKRARRYVRKDIELYNGRIKEIRRIR